jgi:transcriptional regulator GlxA family with amidase domain
MSKFHFIRSYRQATGLTPMDHVRRLRVDHALSLLLTTDLPQKQIAGHAGFANPHHMARYFRRYLDRTPTSFRP